MLNHLSLRVLQMQCSHCSKKRTGLATWQEKGSSCVVGKNKTQVLFPRQLMTHGVQTAKRTKRPLKHHRNEQTRGVVAAARFFVEVLS